MNLEIERKFLVKSMPDLSGIKKESYERYYLFIGNGVEVRIQKINDKYVFERKVKTSKLGRKTYKFEITKAEFDLYKKTAGTLIVRDNYILSNNPEVSLKIYHGKFEGLIRAEIEFKSEKEARIFKPFKWMGREITNSPLGRDSRLIKLSTKEFKALLSSN